MCDNPSTTPNMPNQVVHAYKDATDNLMYLKKEQVQITYYTWLLLAALYVLSRNQQTSDNAKAFLATGTILVGVASISFICSFHRSMAGFRRRLRTLYSKYFDADERQELNLDASDHYLMTFLLSAACFMASGFTFVTIINQ
jgi:hypothetical protein